MNRIIDNHNFIPAAVRHESDKAIIIHELGVEPSGLQACAHRGMNPAILPKEAIGVWDCSIAGCKATLAAQVLDSKRRVQAFALAHLAKIAQEVCDQKNISTKDLEEHTDVIKVFKNVDILAMFVNCGFTRDEFIDHDPDTEIDTVSPSKLSRSSENLIVHGNRKNIMRHIYAYSMLAAFTRSARKHDAHNPNGGNHKKKRFPTEPTLEQLEASIASFGGIGYGKWVGSCDFLGWNGCPDPLILDAISGDKVQMSPVFLSGIGNRGQRHIEDSKTGEMACVSDGWDLAMLSIPSATEHSNYREMNWHLRSEEFEKNPVGNNTNVMDTSELNSRKGIWCGSPSMYKHINEGLAPCGTIVFPHDVRDEALHIARYCRVFRGDIPDVANVFAYAVAHLASRMISTYGQTGASIVYQLTSGYMINPTISTIAFEDPKHDAEFQYKYAQANTDFGPLFIEAVINKVQVNNVMKKGDARDRFIDTFHASHMPDAKRSEVESEIDRALERLQIYVDRCPRHNFLDHAGKAMTGPSIDLVSNDDFGANGRIFTDSMDMFIDAIGDPEFIEQAKKWKEHLEANNELAISLARARCDENTELDAE